MKLLLKRALRFFKIIFLSNMNLISQMIKLFESNKSILIKNNFQFVSYSMSDYNAKECLLIPYSRPCGIYRASFGQRSSPV